MIKTFAIFANTRKTKDTEPDYIIKAKIGEVYEEIGGAWLKERVTPQGSYKFFSCKLRNEYKESNKKGYVIIEESTPINSDFGI